MQQDNIQYKHFFEPRVPKIYMQIHNFQICHIREQLLYKILNAPTN